MYSFAVLNRRIYCSLFFALEHKLKLTASNFFFHNRQKKGKKSIRNADYCCSYFFLKPNNTVYIEFELWMNEQKNELNSTRLECWIFWEGVVGYKTVLECYKFCIGIKSKNVNLWFAREGVGTEFLIASTLRNALYDLKSHELSTFNECSWEKIDDIFQRVFFLLRKKRAQFRCMICCLAVARNEFQICKNLISHTLPRTRFKMWTHVYCNVQSIVCV